MVNQFSNNHRPCKWQSIWILCRLRISTVHKDSQLHRSCKLLKRHHRNRQTQFNKDRLIRRHRVNNLHQSRWTSQMNKSCSNTWTYLATHPSNSLHNNKPSNSFRTRFSKLLILDSHSCQIYSNREISLSSCSRINIKWWFLRMLRKQAGHRKASFNQRRCSLITP